MTIYLVNYDPDNEITLVVDGKPKTLGPKKTETIPDNSDITIRVQPKLITVEHKSEVQHED